MDHQTFAQLLGNYGEFIGAIAVVGTLLYLAVQVRQSREALRANTRALDGAQRQARVDALREIAFNWNGIVRDAMGSHDAASIFLRGNRDLGQLDEVEQQIFTAQLIPFLNQSLVVLQMAQEGLLGDEIVGDDIAELLDGLVGDLLRNNPGALVCWQAMAHSFAHRDHLNALIEREGDPNRYTLGKELPIIAMPSAEEATKLAQAWVGPLHKVHLVQDLDLTSLYNVSPSDYLSEHFFFFVETPGDMHVGRSRYLAVDRVSGEVSDAGWHGE